MTPPRDHVIKVRVDATTAERLRALVIASPYETSVSGLTRQALMRMLDEHEAALGLCEVCHKRRAVEAPTCPGDKAQHRHGRIHLADGGLAHVCGPCCAGEIAKWNAKRQGAR